MNDNLASSGQSYRESAGDGLLCIALQLSGRLLAALGVAHHIGATQHHCHHYHKQVVCSQHSTSHQHESKLCNKQHLENSDAQRA